jgi:hypothetical protein
MSNIGLPNNNAALDWGRRGWRVSGHRRIEGVAVRRLTPKINMAPAAIGDGNFNRLSPPLFTITRENIHTSLYPTMPTI